MTFFNYSDVSVNTPRKDSQPVASEVLEPLDFIACTCRTPKFQNCPKNFGPLKNQTAEGVTDLSAFLGCLYGWILVAGLPFSAQEFMGHHAGLTITSLAHRSLESYVTWQSWSPVGTG